MKIYISADMEGIAGLCAANEMNKDIEAEYGPFRDQMTAEVSAACTGAYAAGANELVVKDAHWTGRNIDPHKLLAPAGKSLRLIRGWSRHPFLMVQELDNSFHAAVFIGYHSAAGTGGNPLAHTLTTNFFKILLNDAVASEFLIYAYAAASVNVPVVFLSGDKFVCEAGRRLIDGIETVETMEGVGDSVISILPSDATRLIEQGVKKALGGRLASVPVLPTEFALRVTFAKPTAAYARSFYPGAKQVSDVEVSFETKDYNEVLAFLLYAGRG